jgi:diacylglycerol O-acyltransferase
MARYAYDRLTALDNSFLVLERPNAYMHVASTMIFDAGPLKRADGGVDAEAIKGLIASTLQDIPRYRQRLVWTPIYNNPVWVDDERFSIDFHVRHTSLPRPGDTRQLKRLSARVMEQHLDRRRPLWEMWIVEGLEDDRLALISKVHHCMIDGISGVDIMRVLMSLTPEIRIKDAPPFVPRPAPSALELTAREALRWAGLPLRAVRGVGHLLGEARDLRRQVVTSSRAIATTLGGTLRPPSSTPINGEIGPHRRFDWMTMELADIKEVRKLLGGSLNDVVLTIVTGAIRRLLVRRQVRPNDLDFRIMAPVSVRTAEEQGHLGNRVSAWIVELPVHEQDPERQLAAISERTDALKNAKATVGAEMLTQVAEWTPSTLLSLAGRNVSRLLPFNMVVTNVPGPQVPMYMLGAKMSECFPHVPLTDQLGLGIALLSYNGKLCWGFNADYDLVPDLHIFIEDVSAALAELRARSTARVPEPRSPAHKSPESRQDASGRKGKRAGNGKAARTGKRRPDGSVPPA